MQFFSKGFLRFVLVSGLVLTLASLGLIVALRIWMMHPSDEALLAKFRENRPQFEQLIEMIREDKGLVRVDATWTHPDNPAFIGIPDERIQTYRDMFEALDVPRGFGVRDDPLRIDLISHTYGFAFSNHSSKGYTYTEVTPDLVVDRLDDFRPTRDNVTITKDWVRVTAYRHIQGNWYLYYRWSN